MTHAAPFADLIEVADYTLAVNRCVRAQSDTLRDEVGALFFTYRSHRFPQVSGASDTHVEGRVRRLLRDFCAVVEPPKSYVGFSRGSVCQACGNVIRLGEKEYDVVSGTSEMRLDDDCYKVFIEESCTVEQADELTDDGD